MTSPPPTLLPLYPQNGSSGNIEAVAAYETTFIDIFGGKLDNAQSNWRALSLELRELLRAMKFSVAELSRGFAAVSRGRFARKGSQLLPSEVEDITSKEGDNHLKMRGQTDKSAMFLPEICNTWLPIGPMMGKTVVKHKSKSNYRITTMTLPPHFGLVILSGIVFLLYIVYLGVQVGGARKKFGVDYPKMYDDSKPHFNCFQRAHQNTLEAAPTFLFLLLAGGLSFPIISAIAGFVFTAGRVAYATGYQTGEPKQRTKGAFGYIGLLTLLGTSVYTVVSNL
ncbi:hypothetical protein PROFUN_01642 [Planoprotostelium fungivorum]|uniref:Glutathione S-transferase 3, mitochondrial n=1 Tax=Planoprotostelium fungivorum TaxID=1890364 RepID=A0A2P6NTX9_9EUKA|nr:hypothetical protein PROFUN_01642 [Planoprotostelium fungivorum]